MVASEFPEALCEHVFSHVNMCCIKAAPSHEWASKAPKDPKKQTCIIFGIAAHYNAG